MTAIRKESFAPPEVRVGEILRYLGADNGDPCLADAVESCLQEASGLLKYDVCYGIFPLTVTDNTCRMTFAEAHSADLAKCLRGCDNILLMAATVGMGIDRLIHKYSNLSPTRALILQAIGAERIESLCDMFCRHMSRKYHTSPRFSPGYGDLPLSMQTVIFQTLDCRRLVGMTLNESLLISPSKSVTAIVGLKQKG